MDPLINMRFPSLSPLNAILSVNNNAYFIFVSYL